MFTEQEIVKAFEDVTGNEVKRMEVPVQLLEGLVLMARTRAPMNDAPLIEQFHGILQRGDQVFFHSCSDRTGIDARSPQYKKMLEERPGDYDPETFREYGIQKVDFTAVRFAVLRDGRVLEF